MSKLTVVMFFLVCDMINVFSFKVAKLASEVIKPLVRKMDEESQCDPTVLKALFENGVSLYSMF